MALIEETTAAKASLKSMIMSANADTLIIDLTSLSSASYSACNSGISQVSSDLVSLSGVGFEAKYP